MSHQTGIQADEKLKQIFSKCKANDSLIRVIKISILNEQLIANETGDVSGEWTDDWCKYSMKFVEPRQPCYILFRLDSVNGLKQHEWSLISWTPDDSNVRQKMLYASTKATLKMTFGGGSIVFDYLATIKEEMSLQAFQTQYELNSKQFHPDETEKKSIQSTEHALSSMTIESNSNEHLLTEKEQNLLAIKRDEAHASASIGIKNMRTLPGLQFPLTESAVNAINEFKNAHYNYIQLSINTEKEEIDLTDKADQSFSIKTLPMKIPKRKPCYHLVRFPHTQNDKQYNSVIFIYSVPSEQCPVKERMLYSSCKNSLVHVIQEKSSFAIEIDRKIESDTPEELSVEHLLIELHPPEDTGKPKFAKPKGPSGARGAKRLIKENAGE